MRRFLVSMSTVFAIMLLAGTVVAQPGPGQDGPPRGGGIGERGQGGPGGVGQDRQRRGSGFGQDRQRRGESRARRGRPEQGQRRGSFGSADRMPVFPIMAALDANKDGEISKDEISNAVKALKKLDKNKDGKLSGDEIHPPRGQGRGGPGGFGPPGGPPRGGDFGPPGGGGFGPPGGGFGPPGGDGRQGAGRQGAERGPSANVDDIVAQILLLDKNKDKKISKDELPERMQSMLKQGDSNKDGSLSEKEIRAMAEKRAAGSRAGRGGNRGRERGPNRRQRPEEDDNN